MRKVETHTTKQKYSEKRKSPGHVPGIFLKIRVSDSPKLGEFFLSTKHKYMSEHTPNFGIVRFGDRMMREGEQHLRDRGFVRVTVPRIVPASGACENVDTLFEIAVAGDFSWFKDGKKRAYFAQTGQLYLESLLGEGGLPKVYCAGPSARAEQKVDTRHLTEFEMVEIEFRGSFTQLLSEIESFITRVVKSVQSIPEADRSAYGVPQDISHLDSFSKIFPKIRYSDAIQELGLEWGNDISSAQEQLLIANHGNGPVLITHFPNPESDRMQSLFKQKKEDLAIKFFNMIPDPEDNEHVLSSDCVVPFGGECVGSAARVYAYEEFKRRLFSSDMFKRLQQKDDKAEEGFSWYLSMLRHFPSFPHVGCGFGMSRIFQYLLAEKDITKVVVLPSNRATIY